LVLEDVDDVDEDDFVRVDGKYRKEKK